MHSGGRTSDYDSVVDLASHQSPVVGAEPVNSSDVYYAGTDGNDLFNGAIHNSDDSTDLGFQSSDGSDLSSFTHNTSLSLSSSLRSSLDAGECTTQETQQIQYDLEAEKQKQAEIEAAKEELEMEVEMSLIM